MSVKNFICMVLGKEKQRYDKEEKIKLYEKIKHETERADKWFRLSFERKLKISELEREIKILQEKIDFAEKAVDKFFKTEDETDLLKIAEWSHDNEHI